MSIKTILAATLSLAVGSSAMAAQSMNPMVGGAPMYADKTIVQNASTAPNLTTLVAAVKAAGLVETLQGPGPFTVFAPTNAAFDALPKGTVATLLKPENKAMLVKILTSHVVAGKITAAQIVSRAKASPSGFYNFTTVSGAPLSAQVKGKHVYIYDQMGGAAMVSTADVMQSNGVVHVVNKVLLPK